MCLLYTKNKTTIVNFSQMRDIKGVIIITFISTMAHITTCIKRTLVEMNPQRIINPQHYRACQCFPAHCFDLTHHSFSVFSSTHRSHQSPTCPATTSRQLLVVAVRLFTSQSCIQWTMQQQKNNIFVETKNRAKMRVNIRLTFIKCSEISKCYCCQVFAGCINRQQKMFPYQLKG